MKAHRRETDGGGGPSRCRAGLVARPENYSYGTGCRAVPPRLRAGFEFMLSHGPMALNEYCEGGGRGVAFTRTPD